MLDLDDVVPLLTADGAVVLDPSTGGAMPLVGSAVLVAMFEENGQVRVVLTRRSSHLRSHSGQVAFPGGGRDGGESLEQTALREAHEEIGLDPASVEIVGRLAPLGSPVRSTLVVPFVGLLGGRPAQLEPNPAEVDRIFDVGLAELTAEGVYREELWPRDGVVMPIAFFEVADEIIWGLTARILARLLSLVLQ